MEKRYPVVVAYDSWANKWISQVCNSREEAIVVLNLWRKDPDLGDRSWEIVPESFILVDEDGYKFLDFEKWQNYCATGEL